MKRNIVGALALVLLGGGLITAAPPASAGCQYGGGSFISKCDGPIQPDGTWERCVAIATLVPRGASSFLVPEKHCDFVGLDQHSADPVLVDPPAHIDD